jgi:hypothetical protein
MKRPAATAEAARRYAAWAVLPLGFARRGPVLESVQSSDEAPVTMQSTEMQSLVVGSELVAFDKGVPSTFREDLVNSCLLAQLVASASVPDRSRIFEWYDAYYDGLAEIGWSVDDPDFSIHLGTGDDFEAHEAVQRVLTRSMGEGSAALASIKRSLAAIRAAADAPPAAVFHRETQTANSAHFQIGAVEQDASGPFATLVAFSLQSRVQTAQFLFLRSRTSDVTLRYCSSRMRIDPKTAATMRGPLAERLVAHSTAYIKALPAL